MLCAHPSLGVNSVAELIAYAKANPGQGYATSGVGTNQHILGEWFKKETGLALNHVPYRGAGQAINDLIAGHVKIALLGPTATVPHYKAGNLRLLAQSSAKRAPYLADIPTLEEAGFKGLVLEAWYAAFVPQGTPQRSSRGSTPRWRRRLPIPPCSRASPGIDGAGRRHAGGARHARARGFGEIRAAGAGAQYQDELGVARIFRRNPGQFSQFAARNA